MTVDSTTGAAGRRVRSVEVPQADDIGKILLLVRLAANGGEVTPESLGVVDRQVGYYTVAVRTLGLVDDHGTLTPAGRAIDALPPHLQLARLAVAFDYSPCGLAWREFNEVASIVSIDPDTAEAFVRSVVDDDVETVDRRAGTLRSWIRKLVPHHPFVNAAQGRLFDAPPPEPQLPTRNRAFDRGGSGEIVKACAPGTRDIRVATAYFTVQGFDALASQLRSSHFRLLVGTPDACDNIEAVIQMFRRSIERGMPTPAKRDLAQRLYRELVGGSVRIRHLDAKYRRLHAKVTLFDARAAYVSSANLTHGGLSSNIEAGQLVTAREDVEYYLERFEHYFKAAEELIDKVLPPLEDSWILAGPAHPYHVYLRALLEIYGGVPDLSRRGKYRLAPYQEMIVGSVLAVLTERRGAVLISPTGTGKTVMGAYIAAALFPARCERVIVLPPNIAIGRKWKQTLRGFGLPHELVTHGRVQGKGRKSDDAILDHHALLSDLRPTDLLIVDESHAFRNDESNGFEALQTALNRVQGGRPYVLLLTATPLSTSVDDLNHQLELAVPGETIGRIADVPTSTALVNVTLPFILERFGEATPSGSRGLLFEKQYRYFPRVQIRTRPYDTHLDAVFEVIEHLDLRMGTPGDEPDLFPEFAGLVDTGGSGFLRVVLWRLAESSTEALRGGLRRLQERIQSGACQPLSPRAFGAGLDRLERLVEAAGDDRKCQSLLDLLTAERGAEKVLVFVCHTDTATYLAAMMSARFPGLRVATLTGATKAREKLDLMRRFAPCAQGLPRRQRKNDIDVLVATDTLSEGIDLQDATVLVNYDLHWTSMRLIQRIGRLDRATASERLVRVWNFFPGTDVFERLVGLMGRLQKRSDHYQDLAGTVVLGDHDRDLRDFDEANLGAVKALYEQCDYDRLLSALPPTTNHVQVLGCAADADVGEAKRLPIGARSARYGESPGIFLLLEADGKTSCVFRSDDGTYFFSPADWAAPDTYGHERLLAFIKCESTEAQAALPAVVDAKISEALTRWAEQRGVPTEEITIVCAMLVLPRPAHSTAT